MVDSTPARAVVFDVNGTLTDLSGLGSRFEDVGAPRHLGDVWFAGLLRDGFALVCTGEAKPFAEIGEQGLHRLLSDVALNRDLDAAVALIMNELSRAPVHSDVVDGVRALRDAGWRLVALSNGSRHVAEQILTAAGVRDQFEALLSVDDAGSWKPARTAYDYAARQCATPVTQMVLASVHPWDIQGAARAGMATVWVDRLGVPYPTCFARPTHTVSALTELPAVLDE